MQGVSRAQDHSALGDARGLRAWRTTARGPESTTRPARSLREGYNAPGERAEKEGNTG